LFYDFRGLAFTFLLPLLEIITFFLTIGGVPSNLHFGIVNQELGNFSSCSSFPVEGFHSQSAVALPEYDPDSSVTQYLNSTVYSDSRAQPFPLQCNFTGLSCVFLTDFYDSLETKVCIFESEAFYEILIRNIPLSIKIV